MTDETTNSEITSNYDIDKIVYFFSSSVFDVSGAAGITTYFHEPNLGYPTFPIAIYTYNNSGTWSDCRGGPFSSVSLAGNIEPSVSVGIGSNMATGRIHVGVQRHVDINGGNPFPFQVKIALIYADLNKARILDVPAKYTPFNYSMNYNYQKIKEQNMTNSLDTTFSHGLNYIPTTRIMLEDDTNFQGSNYLTTLIYSTTTSNYVSVDATNIHLVQTDSLNNRYRIYYD